MLDREAAEALFLKHLDWVDKVASIACSNHGVWGADAEDFAAWVRMKLVEDDYAVVRRFRGDSEIKTYLASVVVRHFVNFNRAQRGRWRISAAAERLGAPAADVETLVRRDGYTLQQAGEKLRTAGRTTLSDAELARLLDQLPERAPLRPVVGEPATGLDGAPGASRADERVIEAEAEGRRAEMLGALGTAMEQLELEEQLIVQLHFAEGHTLADVARALRLEQKPLYRRVERLRVRLRAVLESAGLGGDDVRGLLYELDAP
ncbi:RNA polymerase sigma factor [Longimicrobium sp.]|uniref:RNA polymerase sigma factor n=1 Tax=Longimicrobium sp. TaxID=2029185 RepID=UPI002BDE80E3|nr:sigma-70 family RNA polymerase sigma factor [Longimicrobium sp.]HSU17506.1 sigma-70 family RNA polymerase sigma factor [Longimicrobium sp.]